MLKIKIRRFKNTSFLKNIWNFGKTRENFNGHWWEEHVYQILSQSDNGSCPIFSKKLFQSFCPKFFFQIVFCPKLFKKCMFFGNKFEFWKTKKKYIWALMRIARRDTKLYPNRTMGNGWKIGRTQIWGEKDFFTSSKLFKKCKFLEKNWNFGKLRKSCMGIDKKNTYTKFYPNRRMGNE